MDCLKTAIVASKYKDVIDCHIDEDNKVWFSGNDIAKIIGLSTLRTSIQGYDELHKKCFTKDTNGGKQCTIYLSTNGLKRLLVKSRKPEACEFAKTLGLDINHIKYTCIELDFLKAVKETFNGEIIKNQFPVGLYRLDIYMPRYKLAIECDESQHKRQKEKDDEREKKIKEIMKDITFLRFHPEDKNFNIYNMLNAIYKHIISYRTKNINEINDENIELCENSTDKDEENLDEKDAKPKHSSKRKCYTAKKNVDISLFDQFMKECTILGSEYITTADDVRGCFRLWNRQITKEEGMVLTRYMKNNYKQKRLGIWNEKHNSFQAAFYGFKLKHSNGFYTPCEPPNEYDRFIQDMCYVHYTAQVPRHDVTKSFLEWKQVNNLPIVNEQKEMIHFSNYLAKTFIRITTGRFIYRGESVSGGFWGVTLKTNEIDNACQTGKHASRKKPVYKINATTNEVVHTYSSMAECVNDLDKDMFYHIKNKVVYKGHIYTYELPN
jgi:very-short-patch-repair endonuclease